MIGRGWPQQLDRVFRRDCARWLVGAGPLHQMPGRGPVAMAVEQSADDSAAQHSFKRFIFAAGLPLGHHVVAVRKTANVQALRIRWTTAKAGEVGSVGFLNAFRHVLSALYFVCIVSFDSEWLVSHANKVQSTKYKAHLRNACRNLN